MIYQTRMLKVGPDPDVDPVMTEAARLIQSGELVAIPTETVYGLAADARNPDALAKVYAAKQRPGDNPLIVHVADLASVGAFAQTIPKTLGILAEAYWPGPLTVVLKARPEIRESLCRGLDTVALRVPRHPVALALLRASQTGLAAPSANLSGKPSPTKAQHVWQDLRGRIPLILDGGPCEVGIESTVLDLSEDQPAVLRPGMITAQQLSVTLGTTVARTANHDAQRRSPGTKYRHYSPEAKVYLVGETVGEGAFSQLLQRLLQGGKIGYIGRRRLQLNLNERGRVHHVRETPATLSHGLYGDLRDLDERGVHAILIDGQSEDALMDRLTKAATTWLVDDQAVRTFLFPQAPESA